MTSLRKTSLTAGVFYLITFVSIPTLFLYSPVKEANYIVGSGPDTQVLIGGLLEIIVALAGIGTAVTLYPVVKRQNQGVALGFVGMRTLEAATIFAGVVSLLSIVTLRQAGAGADALVTGQALSAQYHWTFLLGQALLPGINAVLLGSLMYKSRLVPRWLPVLGLIGAPIIFASVIAKYFGVYDELSVWSAARGPADRGVGVLARRLPDRQGLQALRHHRRNHRSRHHARQPRRHRLTIRRSCRFTPRTNQNP